VAKRAAPARADVERETYFRLLMLKKIKQAKIRPGRNRSKASDLCAFNRGNPAHHRVRGNIPGSKG
jgi:hypothetical protein